MVWLAMAMAVAAGLEADPIDFNGAFEVPEGKPQGWTTRVWGGRGDFSYTQSGRGGSWSVGIASTDGGDLSWHRRVPVRAYSRYRLSAYIKTDNLVPLDGKGALINIHDGPEGASAPVVGTADWTPVSFEFETGRFESIMINCLFGGWGRATGAAWFDDLRLEYLGDVPLDITVEIDTAQVGSPISEYVYGQFIEHLGRCIYGGIWAELLDDRKFFYAVGAKESPWTASGAVQMQRENAYVGEHTPRLDAGARISQSGIGIVRGKRYEGRIVLSGTGLVTVSLVWGDSPRQRDRVTIRRLSPEYQAHAIRFRAGASVEDARLEIAAEGSALVGTVSLMPADNIDGMRRDTLALLKELDSPVYRWPGGNFVSGYDWRDGIGDRDRRPPRKNPAWLGVEHNDFGIHEFMRFCEYLGTEPYIAVNSGLGDVDMARDEVEYVNGSPDTPMGRLRAQHGRKLPWRCRFWGVGNEMYGDWQLGHMPLENYVKKHNAFADAMRAVDPSIQIVAVGATGRWSEQMLTHCADHMDLLSEHFYCQARPGLIEHVRQVPDQVQLKAKAHRMYWAAIPSLKDKKVPIALDEWNYWYGSYEFGELGTRYFLQDALGIAAGLHEIFRNSDVFYMANYAQTVNVIGAIKTTDTAAAFETTGLVLKLYRDVYGAIPLKITGHTEPLDVTAAWREPGKTLTVAVVNPTYSSATLHLQGVAFRERATAYTITGADRLSHNHPGQKPQVSIEKLQIRFEDGLQRIPRTSIVIYLCAIPR